jgi:hypothetical protein
MSTLNDYEYGFSKPKYLCRWWMKTRKIEEKIKGQALCEFYCPFWAKPLDFIWKLVFGNPELIKN